MVLPKIDDKRLEDEVYYNDMKNKELAVYKQRSRLSEALELGAVGKVPID